MVAGRGYRKEGSKGGQKSYSALTNTNTNKTNKRGAGAGAYYHLNLWQRCTGRYWR